MMTRDELYDLVQMRREQARKALAELAAIKPRSNKQRADLVIKRKLPETLESACSVASEILSDKKVSDAEAENRIKSLFQHVLLGGR